MPDVRLRGRRATITVDSIGEFRFCLHADNGEPIADGEGYTSKRNCLDTVIKYFPDFLIVDTTLDAYDNINKASDIEDV